MKTKYTREEIIELCDKSIVQQKNWRNRDSHEAQKNIAICRGLLLCGCSFIMSKGTCETDVNTIWIEITADGFSFFEGGDSEKETFYIPTAKRLLDRINEDWY